jgi:hypothetical protein
MEGLVPRFFTLRSLSIYFLSSLSFLSLTSPLLYLVFFLPSFREHFSLFLLGCRARGSLCLKLGIFIWDLCNLLSYIWELGLTPRHFCNKTQIVDKNLLSPFSKELALS